MWGIVFSILFVGILLGILILLDVHRQVLALLGWIDTLGWRGAVLFVLLMVLVVVLLLPGILFTTGAGFVFGVVQGSLYVVIGTTVGATIAFLIARHLLGERARRYILAHPRLGRLSEELAPRGWKIVLLTRLVPFFPFKLSNYFFGLMPFSLRGFVAGTAIGVVPFSVHNVYLGAIASDLATLGTRDVGRTPLEWLLYAGGFVATVVLVLYLNRLAQRALAGYSEEGDDGESRKPPQRG